MSVRYKLTNEDGFIIVPVRVIRSRELKTIDKIIYLAISANSPGMMTYEDINDWTGCCRDSITNSIRKLQYLKLIEVKKRGQYNHYRVVPEGKE